MIDKKNSEEVQMDNGKSTTTIVQSQTIIESMATQHVIKQDMVVTGWFMILNLVESIDHHLTGWVSTLIRPVNLKLIREALEKESLQSSTGRSRAIVELRRIIETLTRAICNKVGLVANESTHLGDMIDTLEGNFPKVQWRVFHELRLVGNKMVHTNISVSVELMRNVLASFKSGLEVIHAFYEQYLINQQVYIQ